MVFSLLVSGVLLDRLDPRNCKSRTFLTIIPPKEWHMKIMGRSDAPSIYFLNSSLTLGSDGLMAV